MFRELKRARILFALIISLSVPIFSAYLIYCDISGDDLSSSQTAYENDDIDDLFMSPDSRNQLNFSILIGSTALPPVFFPETNAIEQVSPFCFPSFSLVQRTLVLRC